MANYLLDTTVIIDCLRGRKETVGFLAEIASEGSVVGCCAINIAEVYAGMRETEREVTKRFLDSLEYYEVTRDVAELAGEYKREYAGKGITLSLSDVIIAAVTISNNLILVTDNLRHYPMSELNIQQIEAGNRG
ncbi:MAG: type II toxin-antitoxin system VapC family toxin [Dehalococcoidia bacterium]|nr:type II toxin-antitoxin system VapC family toxin [Dehalococcoidia bacterium]